MKQYVNTANCLTISLLACVSFSTVHAQHIVPSLEWEQIYSDSACSFSSIAETENGGYILGGSLYEIISFDVISSSDVVLARIDTQGEIQWQKIFGGIWQEFLGQVRTTSDGGYILAGTSDSPPSLNKEAPSFGRSDAWVVKVDGAGARQWERTFGGTGGDSADCIWQTSDGGFILGGYSVSGRSWDEESGNKESLSYGLGDGWVVKIDSHGNKQWDRSFGGLGPDQIHALRETPEQGYLLAGSSASDPSSETSPPTGNKDAPKFGGPDGWLIQLDSAGNKQWERTFGGTRPDSFKSLDQGTDGGFILGGGSQSPPSGNKDSLHPGGNNYSISDYWIVKVDAAGNKQWDQSYGHPTNSQELLVVRQEKDGGYLLAGRPKLIKTDARGNLQWEQFFSSTKLAASTLPYSITISDLQLTKDGGYIVCGSARDPEMEIPASGCGDNSWVAKFKTILSPSGLVLTWPSHSGVLLESVDNLSDEWQADQTEVLTIGAANAIALDRTGQQRYYRLQGTGINLPHLSFATLLSWPTSMNHILEFTENNGTTWTPFAGDQGTIGATHHALVPQHLQRNYFRTRKLN